MRIFTVAAILLLVASYAHADLYPSQDQLLRENNEQRDELLRQYEAYQEQERKLRQRSRELENQNLKLQGEVEQLKRKQETIELQNDVRSTTQETQAWLQREQHKEKRQEENDLLLLKEANRLAALESNVLFTRDNDYIRNTAANLKQTGLSSADIDSVLTNYESFVYRTAKAAEQGDAKAQYNLGDMYLHGRGIPQDFDKAVLWLKRSTAQGYEPAKAKLEILPNGMLE